MNRIVLCCGVLKREESILLVQSRYAGQAEPLWTLPGGRQEEDESLSGAVVREFAEETSLTVEPRELLYVSESIDERRGLHVVNCTFNVLESLPLREPSANDTAIAQLRFVPLQQAPALLAADVLRIPVAEMLAGKKPRRYFFFDASDVAVPFFDRHS